MKTVLAVDDRLDDLLLLKHACRKTPLDFQLHTANDGHKAIEYLKLNEPGFMLLDLKMPRKSGFEVLSWVRNYSPVQDLKIAIFTSSQNEEDIEHAYGLGADWFLVKPVDYNDLVEIVLAVNTYLLRNDSSALLQSCCYRKPGSSLAFSSAPKYKRPQACL